jgi:non-lysosomal glucosylceramidase
MRNRYADTTRTFDQTATAVAFPLGGIGTGNVSLGARGELRDWEIANRPAKGKSLPNTFFAIRAQAEGHDAVTRVLEGPIQPPHTLSHGYHPSTAAGLPRLANATFRGEYPFASVTFDDPVLPVQIELEAFTPLVPLNPEDSGIPCAILTYTVTNPSDSPVRVTLVGSLANAVGGIRTNKFGFLEPLEAGKSRNERRDEERFRGLYMTAEGIAPDDLHFGSMSLTTTHADVTVKRAWLRGGWWDFLQEFWDDLIDDGLLTDLSYDTPNNLPDTGSLGLLDTLEAGASRTFQFVITWFFPNRPDSWQDAPAKLTRNHYATRFADAWEVARYVHAEMPWLTQGTERFHRALFDSTLPPVVLDAISANIVPVRSNTCFWLEDGRFFGWEGCFDDAGCCPGSCTHVWSYAQTVAFLFPSLEREMRRIEFMVETEDDGFMNFRTFKTFGEEFIWQWGNQKPEAAVDGQMGSILRAYREWQLGGDRAWLEAIWPGIKSAIIYASNQWDKDGDGVLDGRQHNTYDIEFYGPNPLSTIYFLAALRAVEELARVMNDEDLAERSRKLFDKAHGHVEELMWNGEYYIQRLEDVDAYRYQHGTGCLSDHLLGELHAQILGLGHLLPEAHIRSSLAAIYKYNFRNDLSDHVNCQRTYALNGEAGLILCSWPHGGRPAFPFVYSDEVWTGVEYHVAAHLIYEGLLQEGLMVVTALRERHDGIRRNPWDEVECGHHYARSMSSWALLLALSGVHADVHKNEIRFDPILDASPDPGRFQAFWSTGRAWGTYVQHKDETSGEWVPQVEVLGGDAAGLSVTGGGKTLRLSNQPTSTGSNANGPIL